MSHHFLPSRVSALYLMTIQEQDWQYLWWRYLPMVTVVSACTFHHYVFVLFILRCLLLTLPKRLIFYTPTTLFDIARTISTFSHRIVNLIFILLGTHVYRWIALPFRLPKMSAYRLVRTLHMTWPLPVLKIGQSQARLQPFWRAFPQLTPRDTNSHFQHRVYTQVRFIFRMPFSV